MKWYYLDIDTLEAEDYAGIYALLSGEEQARVDRFRRDDDRKRTLAGQLLARRALGLACGTAPQAIPIEKTADGKPYAPGLAVEFSVSHCGKLAVCAVDDRPVGIDVEMLRPVNLRIARKVCSPEELCYLFGSASAPPEEDVTEEPAVILRFFRLWTGKEAIAKREGKGVGSLHACFPLQEPGIQYETVGAYLICICPSGK